MKEKYEYESVKEIGTVDAILLFGGLILLCYLIIEDSYLEKRTIWILASITASVWGCFIGRICISMCFTADDNAVTFSRIFRKRIAYSSIKSIDLRTEARTYKTKEGMRRIKHTYYTEIITFHCEDGDAIDGIHKMQKEPILSWLPFEHRNPIDYNYISNCILDNKISSVSEAIELLKNDEAISFIEKITGNISRKI